MPGTQNSSKHRKLKFEENLLICDSQATRSCLHAGTQGSSNVRCTRSYAVLSAQSLSLLLVVAFHTGPTKLKQAQQTSHPVQFLVGSKPRFVISCDIPCQAREAQATYNARFPMQFLVGSEPSYRKLKSKKPAYLRLTSPLPSSLASCTRCSHIGQGSSNLPCKHSKHVLHYKTGLCRY